MTCEECEELLAVNAVGNPGTGPPVTVSGHLHDCVRCTESARRYEEIASGLPLALPPVKPPSELRQRIMTTVYAEAQPERPAAPIRALRTIWSAFPQGRRWVATAAAVAAVFAGWGISRSAHGTPTVTDSRTVAVVGTTEQPSARGVLTYDYSTHTAVIDVENLQPLPSTGGDAKTAYEVWLIKKGHSPVGVGFLTLQPDGRQWTTATHFSAGQYDEMAVTAEPAGGSPTPTGPPVVTSLL